MLRHGGTMPMYHLQRQGCNVNICLKFVLQANGNVWSVLLYEQPFSRYITNIRLAKIGNAPNGLRHFMCEKYPVYMYTKYVIVPTRTKFWCVRSATFRFRDTHDTRLRTIGNALNDRSTGLERTK